MNSASHSKSSLTLALDVMPFYESDIIFSAVLLGTVAV